MERSSKHGPRLDDQMVAETESIVRSGREARAEEWREAEPSGEDQVSADQVLAGGVHGDPYPELGHDELEQRAELARHLRASVWPARRDALIGVARDENAPDDVLQLLRRLPEDREFENLQDLWHALGHPGEQHRF